MQSQIPAHVNQLQSVTEVLLNETSDESLLEQACADLYTLLATAGGEPCAQALAKINSTRLIAGLAISPADAANCIRDAKRTAVFLRGVRDAIVHLQRLYPLETIEILYAGNGPMAPLAVALMPLFLSGSVRFTLIDVHPYSVESARHVVEHFGFGNFVRAIVQGDASTYRHPYDVPLHVAVVETLQHALSEEPQAAISMHLIPQLVRGGVLVPQEIVVALARLPHPANSKLPHAGEVVATLLRFNKDLAVRLNRRNGHVVPLGVVQISSKSASTVFALITTIQTFGRHHLRIGESGLTFPKFLWDLQSLNKGEWVRFYYDFGAPSIRWEVVRGRPAA